MVNIIKFHDREWSEEYQLNGFPTRKAVVDDAIIEVENNNRIIREFTVAKDTQVYPTNDPQTGEAMLMYIPKTGLLSDSGPIDKSIEQN